MRLSSCSLFTHFPLILKYFSHCRSQPYLGWRSQTSLNNLDSNSTTSNSTATTGSKYLSAAERLALSMPQHKLTSKTPATSVNSQQPTTHQPTSSSNSIVRSNEPTTQQPTSSNKMVNNGNRNVNSSTDDINNSGNTGGVVGCDIHSSIKEVTSAIVHYCSERAPRSISPRLSSTTNSNLVDVTHLGKSSTYGSTSENLASRRAGSPRRPQLWLESSFVGSRPIDDSPETPSLPPMVSPLQPISRPPTAPPALSSPPRASSSKSLQSAAPSSKSLPSAVCAQPASTSSSSSYRGSLGNSQTPGTSLPPVPKDESKEEQQCSSPTNSSTAPPPSRPNTEALQRLTMQYYTNTPTDYPISCGESQAG